MLPDRCSVKQQGRMCQNPPEFVISVVSDADEYMIGVTCEHHKNGLSARLEALQKEGKIPNGKINFVQLKAVGTDCIKGNPDDLIQL
ncbi:MAG: hypothetical protein WAO91_01320 [Candidatus Nitrosotenuis sp.]